MAHSLEEVRDNIQSHLQHLNKDPRQSPAIDKWFDVMAAKFDMTCRGQVSPEDPGNLREYFNLLSHILFDGTLTLQHCPIRMVWSVEEKWKRPGNSLLASCTDQQLLRDENVPFSGKGRPSPGNIQAPITIYENVDEKDPLKRLCYYLGLLIHEMVHAVLSIFPCKCDICFRPGIYQDGETGHGIPWLMLSYVIETFCKVRLGLPSLDLERMFSAVRELHENQLDFEALQLYELGLDEQYIEEYLEWMRSPPAPDQKMSDGISDVNSDHPANKRRKVHGTGSEAAMSTRKSSSARVEIYDLEAYTRSRTTSSTLGGSSGQLEKSGVKKRKSRPVSED